MENDSSTYIMAEMRYSPLLLFLRILTRSDFRNIVIVYEDRVGIIRFVNETVNDATNFNLWKKSFQVSFEKRTTPRATVDKPTLRSDDHFWHVEHTRVISDSNEIHRAGIELVYPYTLLRTTIYDPWANDVLPE